MTTDDEIKDEKLLYGINRVAEKISALSSGEIDKYVYLTGEEILPLIKKQIIEQAMFIYFPLGKALEKQTQKQIHALKSVKRSNRTNELKQIQGISPKYLLNDLVVYKLKEIVQLQDITIL